MKSIYYKIKNYFQLREYRKMHTAQKFLAIYKYVHTKNIKTSQDSKSVPKNILRIAKQAIKANDEKIDTLYFGDSVGAFLRHRLKSVPVVGNFYVSGDVGKGFSETMEIAFRQINGWNIKYIVLGTFGNNALQYQNVKAIIHELEDAYAIARLNCPDAKIIFIGYPPVYDVYANMCAPLVEDRMRTLDENSVLIDLNDFGVLPSLDFSSDGVHLSEYGAYKFDRKIERAKN